VCYFFFADFVRVVFEVADFFFATDFFFVVFFAGFLAVVFLVAFFAGTAL